MAAANFGGYDNNFVDKDLDKFTCNICTKVLKDPHLTGCCGQQFCESCLNYWFTKHGKESCPHCRAEGKEFQHLLNKSLKREIDSLRIHCTSKEEGCQWIGELRSLKNHLESANGCGYVEVECPNECSNVTFDVNVDSLDNRLNCKCYPRPYKCKSCDYQEICDDISDLFEKAMVVYSYKAQDSDDLTIHKGDIVKIVNKTSRWWEACLGDVQGLVPSNYVELIAVVPGCATLKCAKCGSSPTFSLRKVKRKDLKNHLESECDLRPYECKHCGFEDKYWVMVTHLCNTCPEFPLECPNKCGIKDIKRKDMEDHRIQCPEEPVQCPFKEAGCKEKLVQRELQQHMSATQKQHLLMVMGAYREIKKENEELKRANKEMKKANKKIKEDSMRHIVEMRNELKEASMTMKESVDIIKNKVERHYRDMKKEVQETQSEQKDQIAELQGQLKKVRSSSMKKFW